MRSILAVVACLLAGCTGSPTAPGDAPMPAAPPEPAQPLGVPPPDVPNGTVAPQEWSAFQVQETGHGGEWLVIYQPFPEPLEGGLGYSYQLDARAESQAGEPLLFVLGPTFVAATDDGPAMHGVAPFDRQGLVVGSGGFVQNAFGGSIGYGTSATLLGVLVAVASDSPWSLDVSFEMADAGGGLAQPALRRGTGAVLHVGADRAHGLPDGPAGSLRLEADMAAGWTHLQVVNVPLEPTAVHSFEYTLPGGAAVGGLAYRHGYWIPVAGGGGASGSGMVEHFGGTGLPAGRATMDLTYVAADLSLELGYVNLPTTDPLLGEGPGVYSDSAWPFPDQDDGG